MTYISKIGVELEGGWPDGGDGDSPISTTGISMIDTLGQDVSVSGLSTPHMGEAASPPLLPKEGLEWLKSHYPSEVNANCGFHIHVSFKSTLSYSRLMEEVFWNHFLHEAEVWGKKMKFPKTHQFWKRLNGDNRFAVREFKPDLQVESKSKGPHRQTQLNYCYGFHGTIECRLMPAFLKVEEAVKAVEWLLSTYDTYLDTLPKAARKTIVVTKEDIFRKKLPVHILQAIQAIKDKRTSTEGREEF